MSSLKVGKKSTLTFVQGRAYVVRIVGETTVPPKPFAKVQEEIERQLEPVQLREALESIGAAAVEQVRVERFNERLDGTPEAEGRGQKTEARVSAAKTDGRPKHAPDGEQKGTERGHEK